MLASVASRESSGTERRRRRMNRKAAGGDAQQRCASRRGRSEPMPSDLRLATLGVIERPDGALEVTVRQVVRSREGLLLSDERVLHVYRLEDGLVARMRVED
jgi:hypothetical protein